MLPIDLNASQLWNFRNKAKGYVVINGILYKKDWWYPQ